MFVDILNNDEGQRPLVVSASYAYDCDTDSCLGDGVTEYYDSVFQSLAALGVSVVISGGDDGTNDEGRALKHTYGRASPRALQRASISNMSSGEQQERFGDQAGASAAPAMFDTIHLRQSYHQLPASPYIQHLA